MFRLWVKLVDDSAHMLKDITIENSDPELNRTRKVFNGLEEACYKLDLSVPIWLDLNANDFRKHSKTRFTQDNFTESIDFHYMEIQVIEED